MTQHTRATFKQHMFLSLRLEKAGLERPSPVTSKEIGFKGCEQTMQVLAVLTKPADGVQHGHSRMHGRCNMDVAIVRTSMFWTFTSIGNMDVLRYHHVHGCPGHSHAASPTTEAHGVRAPLLNLKKPETPVCMGFQGHHVNLLRNMWSES